MKKIIIFLVLIFPFHTYGFDRDSLLDHLARSTLDTCTLEQPGCYQVLVPEKIKGNFKVLGYIEVDRNNRKVMFQDLKTKKIGGYTYDNNLNCILNKARREVVKMWHGGGKIITNVKNQLDC